MTEKPEHPLPSQGGSYTRDPVTGELTLIVEAEVAAEKPAPAKPTAPAKTKEA
jgi:hypothetical protein